MFLVSHQISQRLTVHFGLAEAFAWTVEFQPFHMAFPHDAFKTVLVIQLYSLAWGISSGGTRSCFETEKFISTNGQLGMMLRDRSMAPGYLDRMQHG
ncbi:hypothetical protein ACQKWADRAFT_262164 [Trichoderma austrokoningii]